MDQDEIKANKLIYLSYVTFGAEDKHQTLSKSLPEVLFKASHDFLIKAVWNSFC